MCLSSTVPSKQNVKRVRLKSIVYAAALDKGFNPATAIQDAPIVYEGSDASNVEGQAQTLKSGSPITTAKSLQAILYFAQLLCDPSIFRR